MISWVFYDVNIDFDGNGGTIFEFMNAFTFIGQIWVYQFVFTIGLIDIIGGTCIVITIITGGIIEESYRYFTGRRNNDEKCCCLNTILIVLMIICAYAVGLCIAPIIMEIVHYIAIAFILYDTIDDKLPTSQINSYYVWKNIEKFILNSKSRKDRLLRIISINKHLINVTFNSAINNTDINSDHFRRLNKFITNAEKTPIKPGKLPFNNIKFNDIIENSPNLYDGGKPYYFRLLRNIYISEFIHAKDGIKRDWRRFMDNNNRKCVNFCNFIAELAIFIGVSGFFFIGIPIWIISRLFKLVFPWFILGYIIYHDYWDTTDLFQLIMLFIYLLLNIILWILSVHVYKLYHSLWHITPDSYSKRSFKNQYNSYLIIKNINEYYNDCISIPVRLSILNNIFGSDIALIIHEYCPNFNTINDINLKTLSHKIKL